MRVVVAEHYPHSLSRRIGQIDLLPKLFGTIFIPSIVHCSEKIMDDLLSREKNRGS